MTAQEVSPESVQGQVVWTPSGVSSTRIDKFRRRVEAKHSVKLPAYDDLWRWSVSHPSSFWAEVWAETGVISSQPFTEALEGGESAGSKDKEQVPPIYPPPRWFVGAKLNFAENLLRHRGSQTAIIQSTEADPATGNVEELKLSRDELRSQVAAAACALRKRGVKPNDILVSYSSNCAANLVASLAAAAVGAVWSSVAAESAPEAVLDRFTSLKPRLMFSVNAVRYNGKVHPHTGKIADVLKGMEAAGSPIEEVVMIDYVAGHDSGEGAKAYTKWSDFLGPVSADDEPEYEQLDFNHPLWILFSSGTTGKPKAICHRAGGMLLQLSKEHLIHGGTSESDVFYYFSTTQWMMWQYCITSLVAGCPVVLYDGSPLKPVSVLWELAERHGVTIFGTSAAYLAALQKSGYEPRKEHPDLKVRQVLSTGSPLRADLYPWIMEAVGPDTLIGSITGGTDICSLFAGHNEALPVRAGEIQARNLGMDIDVFDPAGNPVGLGKGEGDLVCKTPFPAQPLYFWGQDKERYFQSYYAQYPGVWYHGDHVRLSENGGLVMLGRSDGILNPGGVRMGTSEFYELIEAHRSELPGVQGSLVCALKHNEDEVVVLFLVIPDSEPTSKPDEFEKLAASVKKLIRSKRSARHVPRFIERVRDTPRTVNGKLSEVPTKKLINGAPLSAINTATLANAECLEEYIEIGQRLRAELAKSG